jgi:c-di-GMP-binding flagellar brake protein YcgR
MNQDRRLFRRVPLEAEVAFQEVGFGKEAQPVQTTYKDVSVGGLLITSPQQRPLGTLLKLEVRVPGLGRHQNTSFELSQQNLRPLVAVGQVVRIESLDSGEFELGIKFLNTYPEDLKALMSLINSSDQDLQS